MVSGFSVTCSSAGTHAPINKLAETTIRHVGAGVFTLATSVGSGARGPLQDLEVAYYFVWLRRKSVLLRLFGIRLLAVLIVIE